jgi:hypothetical protein
MLMMPARKVRAAQRPVNASGVALTNVPEKELFEVKAVSRIR